MKAKARIAFSLAAALVLSACGATAMAAKGKEDTKETTAAEESTGLNNETILKTVLDEFGEIAKVPRPSGHTEAISAYLTEWGKEHGFETVCDEVGNVIMEIPATEGYEKAAVTILQVHSDMVCVSDDPDWDGVVTPRIVGNDLYATDTSLGGDDGIGIATAMFLVTSPDVVHGPLRLIVTINEEGGSPSGVGNLDPKCVDGVDYMINIDSEDYATCTVAACGFTAYAFNDTLNWVEPETKGKVAYEINLSGLKGGHSGVDIDKNRANAIKTLSYCLAWASYNGIETELCSFEGGTGMTAIPTKANVKFLVKADDVQALEELLKSTKADFAVQYDRTEPGYSFSWGKLKELPEKALSVEESEKVIGLVCAVRDGLNTMNMRYPGITETSFNLGTVSVTPESDSFSLLLPMRIMSKWHALQANMQMVAIAKAYGMEMQVNADPSLGWQEREGDVIAEFYAKAFKEYTGEECLITGVHGGLECADFAEWSPTLQIISVGPDVENPHSTVEHVPLDTVAPTAGAVATLLRYIADGDLD
ncbi:MAG: M20/M25/M40 family metallo-hydrolase [Oscillospiraceae bacterium]|nr:M20/M25/M40 family metallo-hydrolase [Oscillospiraceae bacterium]